MRISSELGRSANPSTTLVNLSSFDRPSHLVDRRTTKTAFAGIKLVIVVCIHKYMPRGLHLERYQHDEWMS